MDAAWRVIPERLRVRANYDVVCVEDFLDKEICRDMKLERLFALLDLYQCNAINERCLSSRWRQRHAYLYPHRILDYLCEYEEDFAYLVLPVLIHEIGHYLGLSDADMEPLEREADVMGR